jgi:hypothetical protein
MCLNANYDCVLQCWRVWLNNRIFFTSSLWDSLSSSTTDLGWDQTVFLEILTITGCQQGMDVVQCFGNYWTKVSMSACALGTNWSSTCLFYVLWVETISTWSVKQEDEPGKRWKITISSPVFQYRQFVWCEMKLQHSEYHILDLMQAIVRFYGGNVPCWSHSVFDLLYGNRRLISTLSLFSHYLKKRHS